MRPMTKRQRDVLDAIDFLIKEHGYGPSYAEIGTRVGLSSSATVSKHVKALVHRGYLRRHGFNSKRSLEVVEARRDVLRSL